MKLSFIIPTYNMAGYLERSLVHLAAQESPGCDLEVVIVDDGSSDDTREVAQRHRPPFPQLYHFIPRGPASGRSQARNEGLRLATGELIAFLDSGVLVAPGFARTVRSRLTEHPRSVLLHYVCGIRTPNLERELSTVSGVTPANCDALLEQLALDPDWNDPREAYFETQDRVPVPWFFGWTTALSLKRELLDRVGMFETKRIRGYGGEDHEISLRLMRAGASLDFEQRAKALHLPHDSKSENYADQLASRAANARGIFELHPGRDTELYTVYFGFYFCQVVARLDGLNVAHAGPFYKASHLGQVSAMHLSSGESTLAVGFDDAAMAEHLHVTHMFAHNAAAARLLRRHFPGRSIHEAIGAATTFADRTFGITVLSPFVRMVGPALRQAMFRELKRISKRVLLLGGEPSLRLYQDDGQTWATEDELRADARAVGLSWRDDVAPGPLVELT